MENATIVENYLKTSGKCYGHCDGKTELVFLERGKKTISCMVCPGGYVSRIVLYGDELDVEGFLNFIREKLGESGDVSSYDIRTATRHPWDLGTETEADGENVIREAYWTQNYRRTKSEDPNRNAIFHCSECNSLYLSPVSGGGKHVHGNAKEAA